MAAYREAAGSLDQESRERFKIRLASLIPETPQ
jgi:hypothetical protein